MWRLYKRIEQRVGGDRVLHFMIGALIVAQFEYFSFQLVLISIILVFTLSLIKEFTGERFDWYDILATMLGALFQLGVFVIKFKLF